MEGGSRDWACHPCAQTFDMIGLSQCWCCLMPMGMWLHTWTCNGLLAGSCILMPQKARVTPAFAPRPQLFCYTSLTALGVWATHNQPWLTDTSQLWAGWPNQAMT